MQIPYTIVLCRIFILECPDLTLDNSHRAKTWGMTAGPAHTHEGLWEAQSRINVKSSASNHFPDVRWEVVSLIYLMKITECDLIGLLHKRGWTHFKDSFSFILSILYPWQEESQ